jgi:hypothetical protein
MEWNGMEWNGMEWNGMECTRQCFADLLLESWEQLSESAISSGWDCGEDIEDLDEPDDSNDEFELQMSIQSDDEVAGVDEEETDDQTSPNP